MLNLKGALLLQFALLQLQYLSACAVAPSKTEI